MYSYLRNPASSRDDGFGTDTHRPGAWKPLSKLQCASCRRTENSLAFAVGVPVAYVQAPKAKGHGDRVSTGFPTPRPRVLGLFAGAHRRRFPGAVGGLSLAAEIRLTFPSHVRTGRASLSAAPPISRLSSVGTHRASV